MKAVFVLGDRERLWITGALATSSLLLLLEKGALVLDVVQQQSSRLGEHEILSLIPSTAYTRGILWLLSTYLSVSFCFYVPTYLSAYVVKKKKKKLFQREESSWDSNSTGRLSDLHA